MKKRIIIFLAIISFCFCLVINNCKSVYADGLTMSMVVNSAYAIAQTSGLKWIFTGMNGNQAKTYLENEINSWLGSKTIAEKFGTEAVRLQLGKYIVGAELYNGIANFLSDFSSKNLDYYGDNNLIYVKLGVMNYVPAGIVAESATTSKPAYNVINSKTGQSNVVYGGIWSNKRNPTNDGIESRDTGSVYQIWGKYSFDEGSVRSTGYTFLGDGAKNDYKTVAVNDSSYVAPTVIDPSQAWVGQFYGVPDTNLDDLINGALDDLADNNLVVDGEVTDPPAPPPTPVPVDRDTPLSDVPWGGLDDAFTGIDTNLDRLYEQGLEEIGTIGEAKDGIIDAINEQTGAIADSITNQNGVISGAIDQAVSHIQTAIGEQTGVLDESLTATAEGVNQIAEALEPGKIKERTFDLRELFPFCIPFDIYHLLQNFDGSPQAPHVQIPIVINSIGFSYTMDLDFSPWDTVAATMRTVELIVYAIGLAWATSKVIKW